MRVELYDKVNALASARRARRPFDGARREDPTYPCTPPTSRGHDPELRRDPACTFRARRLRPAEFEEPKLSDWPQERAPDALSKKVDLKHGRKKKSFVKPGQRCPFGEAADRADAAHKRSRISEERETPAGRLLPTVSFTTSPGGPVRDEVVARRPDHSTRMDKSPR